MKMTELRTNQTQPKILEQVARSLTINIIEHRETSTENLKHN